MRATNPRATFAPPRRAAPDARSDRRAGLEGRYRFHDTRAAFCTALAEHGASAINIQWLAGHASISTTLRCINASELRLRETVARPPGIDCSQ